MDHPSTRRIALMSIHPEYAEALLNGTKTVELRKSQFAGDISHIVIYATSPIKQVLGWVKATRIERGSPSKIWETHKAQAGIRRSAYRAYFRGRSRATAIHVDSPERLANPLPLSAIEEGLIAPQSWRYLSTAAARNVGIPL